MKTDRKFNAILAKNGLARELKEYIQHREPLHISWIIGLLHDIEAYTGEDNQPSVDEILNTTMTV